MLGMSCRGVVLSLSPLPFAFLVVACGGKTVLLTGSEGGDAGIDAHTPLLDAGGTLPETGPTPDAGTGCPPQTELLAVGAPCGWSGTCTVLLEYCDGGSPTLFPLVCLGGFASLPPDTGIGCTHHTGGSCPPGLVIGGACTGDTACQTDYCGPGDETTCTCVDGAWACPDVSCLPPTLSCTNGEACTSDLNCQTPDGCETSCTCVVGAFQCTTSSCAGSDAGSGPLPQCGPGGGCAHGSCLGPDGCGSEVVCTCSENTLSCPVVTC